MESAPPHPVLGEIVIYASRFGSDSRMAAIVIRTRSTTNAAVIDRWGPKPDGSPGAPRPADLQSELPDDTTVDLMVLGLSGVFPEYSVPYVPPESNADGSNFAPPRTWSREQPVYPA